MLIGKKKKCTQYIIKSRKNVTHKQKNYNKNAIKADLKIVLSFLSPNDH